MLRTCSSYTVQTGGPGGTVTPACPGPGRQAQSRNSALAQMTQGISGSGVRRWSVRKPCLAVPVRSRRAPLGVSCTRGRERPPASLWSLSGRSERDPPRRAGTSMVRPRGAGGRAPPHPSRPPPWRLPPRERLLGDTAWAEPLSHKGKLPKQDGSDRLEGAHTVRPFCCFL